VFISGHSSSDQGQQRTFQERIMTAIKANTSITAAGVLAAAALLVTWLGATALAAEPKQSRFETPEAATEALMAALKADDDKATLDILGAASKPLIDSGDPVADENARAGFVERYDEAHVLLKTDDTATLQVGSDEWPFPIPLERHDDGWRFDAGAGAEEIVNRRIGNNELSAIQACLAYVDAQREYYSRNPQHAAVLQYAQKFVSTPGKRDGLYWDTAEEELDSPLGPLFVSGRSKGYTLKGRGEPYYGYRYRILTAQGPDAEGGAYNYIVQGKMMGGFALVAHPAKWDVSGVMTFLVNHDGVVFQKDLGPTTAKQAEAMKTFNPDSSWARVEPESPADLVEAQSDQIPAADQ
jgi:hypothetical protein